MENKKKSKNFEAFAYVADVLTQFLEDEGSCVALRVVDEETVAFSIKQEYYADVFYILMQDSGLFSNPRYISDGTAEYYEGYILTNGDIESFKYFCEEIVFNIKHFILEKASK